MVLKKKQPFMEPNGILILIKLDGFGVKNMQEIKQIMACLEVNFCDQIECNRMLLESKLIDELRSHKRN